MKFTAVCLFSLVALVGTVYGQVICDGNAGTPGPQVRLHSAAISRLRLTIAKCSVVIVCSILFGVLRRKSYGFPLREWRQVVQAGLL